MSALEQIGAASAVVSKDQQDQQPYKKKSQSVSSHFFTISVTQGLSIGRSGTIGGDSQKDSKGVLQSNSLIMQSNSNPIGLRTGSRPREMRVHSNVSGGLGLSDFQGLRPHHMIGS